LRQASRAAKIIPNHIRVIFKVSYGLNVSLRSHENDYAVTNREFSRKCVGIGLMMSVDQYAATLASWFSVEASDLSTVAPNISNYLGSPLGTDVGLI
jgi:hypothetical protein